MKTAVYQNIKPRERSTHRPSREVPLSLVYEGAFSNVFIILTGGAFLTGMALLFRANDFEIGLLAAMPFLMQCAQILSPFLFRNVIKARSRIVSILGFSRILWLAVLPLLFLAGWWQLPVLIGIVAISGLLTMLVSPVWLSWMADLVPQNIRGVFFSRRNAAIAVTTVSGTILGSLILDWSRSENVETYGYSAIILLAVIGALFAWRSMRQIQGPAVDIPLAEIHRPNLLAPFRDRSFRSILKVFSAWNVAVGLSAAFFAPHMLLNLRMSFFQIGLYTCGTAIVGIISSRAWGGLIDRFGSKPILNLCAFGIGFIPLIWLFPASDSLWILIPEAVYSGFMWSGFNVAAFTLPLDRSPANDRTLYLSVFAAITGLTFFAASILAGLAAESLADWTYSVSDLTFVNYHVLFACSAFLRILTAGLILSFHEPTDVRLPVVVQLMGYAVLKRMSIGRQILPFAADVADSAGGQDRKTD